MARRDFAIAKKVLKEISAFKKFKNEIYYGDSDYHDFWEYAREHGVDNEFIEDAFDWDTSREGWEYWNYVDEYWKENWI